MDKIAPAPKGLRGRRWVIGGIIGGVVIGAVVAIFLVSTAPGPTHASAGSRFDSRSPRLLVSGQPVATGWVYVRLHTSANFSGTKLTLQAAKAAGGGYETPLVFSYTVSPEYNEVVEPIRLSAGRWQLTWIAGTHVLASFIIHVAP